MTFRERGIWAAYDVDIFPLRESLSAIDKGESNHPFVQEFENIALQKNITVCWIPGHSGITGNEEADQAAERGRSARIFNRTVPSSDVKTWIKTLVYEGPR